MHDVDLSIPKGKLEAEGRTSKLPHIKMPKVDILLPKSKSKDIETLNPSCEAEINLPAVELGGEIVPKVSSPELDVDATLSRPKQGTEALGEADLHVEGEHKGLKLKIPTIDIKCPKGDLELDLGLYRGEGKKDRKKMELPDLDISTAGTSSKVKGPKVKGTKFHIGMPKKKTGRDVKAEAKICKNCGDEDLGGHIKHKCKRKETFKYEVEIETHNGHKNNKGRVNIPVPECTLPSVCLTNKQGSADFGTAGEGGFSSSRAEMRVPRIPDIDFDIGTTQDEDEDGTEKDKKVKIPKFGVLLPSISSPKGRMNITGPEIQYEGPKMPKVKKAVFVLVNPPQTGEPTSCSHLPKEEATAQAETEGFNVKLPKIIMKPNFGKSKEKSAAVSFSPSESGSFDVNLKGDGSRSNFNGAKDPHIGSKDDKGTFSGKINLPKVQLTSPYGKMSVEGEDSGMNMQLGKDLATVHMEEFTKELKVKSGNMAFSGFSEELPKDVVSSHARTDMLDRDSSESPASFTMEFSSAKVQPWSKVESQSKEPEERESSTWFKVPKFNLKPHSTGFLQITPEGSPQAQRKGEVAGEADVSGSFCLHTSGLDFSTQEISEEHQASSAEEGTVTMVTKTTRVTRHMVSSETRTSESSPTTTTTHKVSDFKY